MASKFSSLMVMVMLLAAALPKAKAAMTCDALYEDLLPCLEYVIHRGGFAAPPPRCCSSVRNLINNRLRLPADRQAACRCLRPSRWPFSDTPDRSTTASPAPCPRHAALIWPSPSTLRLTATELTEFIDAYR
ncbi:non-specific lipid-transfer protein 1-like [Nymphaea colorata]|nr:non-specific lipid-transfer protein 1-like [Nymphaea colorata]